MKIKKEQGFQEPMRDESAKITVKSVSDQNATSLHKY